MPFRSLPEGNGFHASSGRCVIPSPSRPASPGDRVVFERLDLAEVLGIWRHARGLVVGIGASEEAAVTVDVAFDGHETLRGYLRELFRPAP